MNTIKLIFNPKILDEDGFDQNHRYNNFILQSSQTPNRRMFIYSVGYDGYGNGESDLGKIGMVPFEYLEELGHDYDKLYFKVWGQEEDNGIEVIPNCAPMPILDYIII